MRLQSSQAACGRASMSNALKALGLDVTEDMVDRLLKLNKKVGDEHAADGTGGDTMARALSKAPRPWKVRPPELFYAPDPVLAVTALRGVLLGGKAAILCVDLEQHWVSAIGVLGARFLVADPADDELVLSYSEDALAARWAAEGETGRKFGGYIIALRGAP